MMLTFAEDSKLSAMFHDYLIWAARAENDVWQPY